MTLPIPKRISKEEAQKIIEENGNLIVWTHHETQEYFFSNFYRFPKDMEKDGDNWVPASMSIPMYGVTPREGLESGVINNIDEYLLVFHKDDKELALTTA